MHWLIDETKSFIFHDNPSMSWRIAIVAGAALPYEGRKKWSKKYKQIGKASDHYKAYCETKDETNICKILDDLIDMKVEGVLIAGDIGHVSKLEAESFRNDWVSPHYAYADSLPFPHKESLRVHLDNLMGKGENSFSLQDFFKVLGILEVISSFMEMLVKQLPKIRAIDIRKIKLIIDDQAKASLMTLKYFVHYFLWRRSHEGLYNCPPGSMNLIGWHLRKTKDQTFLDTTSLLEKILVEEKANMDDKFPELKIADLLSNFAWHALNGHFSINVVQRLKKIFRVVKPRYFGPNKDVIVTLPSEAQVSINLLLEGSCLTEKRAFAE